MPQKKYSNSEITITWKPALCIHSMHCWKGLASVFDPTRRPWITTDGASTKQIIEQVQKCPSGALSYNNISGSPGTGDELAQ
jgi:uncharacterized Fe-S cluster protein YjdI